MVAEVEEVAWLTEQQMIEIEEGRRRLQQYAEERKKNNYPSVAYHWVDGKLVREEPSGESLGSQDTWSTDVNESSSSDEVPNEWDTSEESWPSEIEEKLLRPRKRVKYVPDSPDWEKHPHQEVAQTSPRYYEKEEYITDRLARVWRKCYLVIEHSDSDDNECISILEEL